MIKIMLAQLEAAIPTLQLINNHPLPAVIGFQFSKMVGEIDQELKYFAEARNKLFEKYGEKDKDGNFKTNEKGFLIISNSGVNDFNKEYGELCEQIIELNYETVKIDFLKDFEVKPDDLRAAMPFLKE